MRFLLHHLVDDKAQSEPERRALTCREDRLTYGELAEAYSTVAAGLAQVGLTRGARVAFYLDKRIEFLVAMLAVSRLGGIFVPVNPVLRAPQVGHILKDCGAEFLVTTPDRLASLDAELRGLSKRPTVLLVGGSSGNHGAGNHAAGNPGAGDPAGSDPAAGGLIQHSFEALSGGSSEVPSESSIDADVAAILYTSGSTGLPKGVVLSHRNLVVGAESVSAYLRNHAADRILSVLPLSFDAGLSQVTTAFCAGAEVVLLNYLLPRDVVRACATHRITGLTGVPPLWIKLAQEEWPEEAVDSLRYFANTGGHMPGPTLAALRGKFPEADPVLMYGLTEAFRSTYLDPQEVDRRPDSIGKAIPNAEVLVINGEGEECRPGEVGELVHRGALVSQGYWNDPEQTARRFRPAPGPARDARFPEIAVWSGDLVKRDEEGFLFFVGRNDAMIKTSGYRVSPTEVEEVVLQTGLVAEVVALGIPDPELGQSIAVLVVPASGAAFEQDALLTSCRKALPTYMVPHAVVAVDSLPRNANGKVDRPRVLAEYLASRSD